MLGPIEVYRHGDYRVRSHGAGTGAEVFYKNESVFMQGEDAVALLDTLDHWPWRTSNHGCDHTSLGIIDCLLGEYFA